MTSLCGLGGHEALPMSVYNGGYYFSHCKHCRCALIKAGHNWETVPHGHQVVWKAGRGHRHSLDIENSRNVPVTYARRAEHLSWLTGLGFAGPAKASPSRDRHADEGGSLYVPVAIAIAIAVLGLFVRSPASGQRAQLTRG